jgi:hypothetical protein
MAEIHAMIEYTWATRVDLKTRAKVSRDWSMPWLCATRLHALLDCYVALGGDVSQWRNKAGILK